LPDSGQQSAAALKTPEYYGIRGIPSFTLRWRLSPTTNDSSANRFQLADPTDYLSNLSSLQLS
jgi:hypothetical protein